MGQVAIITGGASGIGLALGGALVQRGWHVVLDDIDGVQVTDEAQRLSRVGPGSAVGAEVDVADADGLIVLVRDTHAAHGHLDLMVNNAGIGVGGEPDELTLAHWDAAIDVNLRGVIHGCHAAYPLMKQQRSGTILNTASNAALLPPTGNIVAYATTKYAVVGLSLSLRAAGAEYGVHVSVLCPGFIDTPALDATGADTQPAGLPVPPSLQHARPPRELLAQAGRLPYPADRLAEDTLAGLAKNRAILIVPRQDRRYWLMARLLPGLSMRMSEQLTRKSRAASATT